MKKIAFLTGTRADYGKLKSLITISQKNKSLDTHVFITGMHNNPIYGYTAEEIVKAGFKNLFFFNNHDSAEFMDLTLAKTIEGFSKYIKKLEPDLIIIHGDRIEALAGAIVGSLNNILVAHIEGGEISGTIDELIRHSVTKMSHIHLAANEEAKKRLIQLGEYDKSIFILGSPDLDLMDENNLPNLELVRNYYEIPFDNYAIAMFHPVTTEFEKMSEYAENFIASLEKSNVNYILVYPNNDLGSKKILEEILKLRSKNNKKFRIFPSLRFEYFLRLLKESEFIIGNSSAGIREAPYYGVPTIDIGTRQNNRAKLDSIIHSGYDVKDILEAIDNVNALNQKEKSNTEEKFHFGMGRSDQLFLKLLNSKELWNIKHQKQFQDLYSNE